VVLAALGTLPSSGSASAAGLSVISADGGSRALLVAGVAVVVGVALLLLHVLRRRPILLPVALATILLVAQAAAWSSVRGEARALAAAEPAPHGWIDRNAGSGAEVVVAGPAEALDALVIAQLTVWNRTIRGVRELNFLDVDPHSGQVGVDPEADLVLVRGTELAGREIARSGAGVLLQPDVPLNLAETVEGVYPDGWSGELAVYRRFSGARGTVHVLLTREDVPEDAPPAAVQVESGPLDADADEVQARFVLRPGEKRDVEVDVPQPRYRIVVTVSPTFPAADGRQVGAGLRFVYRPQQ
jgi:hypothetical protein